MMITTPFTVVSKIEQMEQGTKKYFISVGEFFTFQVNQEVFDSVVVGITYNISFHQVE